VRQYEEAKLITMSSEPAIPRINLKRIAHVYYRHVDLEAAHQFLLNFGFSGAKRVNDRIYYSGYGTEPFLYCAEKADENAFGGAAWVVESVGDLKLAAETLPGASKIYDLADAPGNGQCVTFKDPTGNFPVHLVYGQTPKELTMSFPGRIFNFVGSMPLFTL
jgi:hypothetical protein